MQIHHTHLIWFLIMIMNVYVSYQEGSFPIPVVFVVECIFQWYDFLWVSLPAEHARSLICCLSCFSCTVCRLQAQNDCFSMCVCGLQCNYWTFDNHFQKILGQLYHSHAFCKWSKLCTGLLCYFTADKALSIYLIW